MSKRKIFVLFASAIILFAASCGFAVIYGVADENDLKGEVTNPYEITSECMVNILDYGVDADSYSVWVYASADPNDNDGMYITDKVAKTEIYNIFMSIYQNSKETVIPSEYALKGGYYRRVLVTDGNNKYTIFISSTKAQQTNFGIYENNNESTFKSYHIPASNLERFSSLCGIKQPIC